MLHKKKTAQKLKGSPLSHPWTFPKATLFLENSLCLFSCEQISTEPKGIKGCAWLWGSKGDPDGLLNPPRGPVWRGEQVIYRVRTVVTQECLQGSGMHQRETNSGVIRERSWRMNRSSPGRGRDISGRGNDMLRRRKG